MAGAYRTILKFVTIIGLVAVACDTLTVLPATVSVVERAAPVVFARSVNDAVPLPLPDPLTVIHETGLDALQAQPAGAVTVRVPVNFVAVVVNDIGATVDEQPVPASETVNAFPAMVRVAERDVVELLAVTLKATIGLRTTYCTTLAVAPVERTH